MKNKWIFHIIWLSTLVKCIAIVTETHWPSLTKKKDGSNAQN